MLALDAILHRNTPDDQETQHKFREINFIDMDYLDPLVHVLNEFIFQALQENRFHSVL